MVTFDEDPLEVVKRFFKSESGGRFPPFEDYRDVDRKGIVGFTHKLGGTPVYLMFPETFTDRFCKKLPRAMVLEALRREKLLVPGSQGRPRKQVRVKGGDERQTFYVIRRAILDR